MKKIITTVLAFCATLALSTTSVARESSAGSQQEAKFLASMSEHHKDGIQMAERAVEKAQSEEVKALAQKIALEQSDELKKMQVWQSNWYPKAELKVESPKMDMTKLEQAQGAEFDRAFIDMMTEHHKKAIDMMKSALGDLKHEKTKSMARRGMKMQAAEVAKMEKLKSSIR